MTSSHAVSAVTSSPPRPRVLVLQVGARLHYAVPTVYARANALHKLYTDACASVGVLSLVRQLIPQQYRNRPLHRLLGRTLPPEVPTDAVRVETLATLAERLRLQVNAKRHSVEATHERLRQRILREGFGDANCLYSLSNGDLHLVKAARNAGLTVLYEQITPPMIGRILREERRAFPGIEEQVPEEEVERGIARDIEIFRLADVVLCASTYVQGQVTAVAGPATPTTVVPYGISDDWLNTPRNPIPGRILFVGNVGLGKGNHYLAEATRLLRRRRVTCEVRVVGRHDPSLTRRPEFQGPTYVGQVPRTMVRSEFAQADVFVLPTLADGCAIVHMEAFACGVPVVTTPNCGSQVRDGVDGFIVPIRDATALADRLEQLIADRDLRERMSQSAFERAQGLTWRRFGDLLLTATYSAMQTASTADRGRRATNSTC